MTVRRSRAADPPDVGALAAEIARLSRAVEALAQAMVELRIDVDEMRSRRRKKPPRGCMAIKDAAGRVGFSYACVRNWCFEHTVKIGATRAGKSWYCELPKLEAFVRTRRARAQRAA
jgi:hypothetical protein